MITILRKRLDKAEVIKILNHLDESFFKQLSERVNLEKYCEKLANNASFEIAENENEVVGIIAFYENKVKGEAYITYVCVSTSKRRMGIADLLMDSICSYMDKERLSVSLEVRKLNTGALNLYTKYGFSFVRENDVRYYMTRK